jgi:adenylate kinase
MIRVILFGAPGAGKGTQADAIEDKYGYKKISTGDLIRAEVKAQTKIGLEVNSIMEKGELVPDSIIIELLKNRLKQDDITNGYIMDGFPRTRYQAEELSRMETDREIVIYLDVINEDVVVKRLLSRLTCSGCGAIFNSLNDPPKQAGKCDDCGGDLIQRADDNEETIRNRISVYKEQTRPVIDYYLEKDQQGSFHQIDASKSVNEIFAAIEGVLR